MSAPNWIEGPWPDELEPLIGYVQGGTVFPPLADRLGDLTVTQAGEPTIVVPFDRAVRDDRLGPRQAEHRDRTLTMGAELYADFVAELATLPDGVSLCEPDRRAFLPGPSLPGPGVLGHVARPAGSSRVKPLSRLFWTVWCLAKAGAFLGWLAIQSLPTVDDAAAVWCRIQPAWTRC